MFDTQKCLKALYTQNSLNKDLATVMQYFVSAKMRTRLRKSAHCDVTKGANTSQMMTSPARCSSRHLCVRSNKSSFLA